MFNPLQTESRYAGRLPSCSITRTPPETPDGGSSPRSLPLVALRHQRWARYAFRIRSGYGFSPPSRERVTAVSFAHAIERGPLAEVPRPVGLGQVRRHRRRGRVPQRPGAAHQRRHRPRQQPRDPALAPRPDLPSRLASPVLCAVPAGLPVVPGGLDGPIPSAGPYYLADRAGNVIVLKRNPNYGGPRPRRPDAIVYEWDMAAGVAAKPVEEGRADYVSALDPALAPATAVARAAGERYRLTPTNWTSSSRSTRAGRCSRTRAWPCRRATARPALARRSARRRHERRGRDEPRAPAEPRG